VILGIGTDLVEINRIERVFRKFGVRFVEKTLSPAEKIEFSSIANRSKMVNFLAKRFSSKESVLKAMGIGMGRGVKMSDLTITYNKYRKPSIDVSREKTDVVEEILDRKIENLNFLISLTDERGIVSSFSIIEEKR
jgi:holo-[acyl-carrier protein] synthase